MLLDASDEASSHVLHLRQTVTDDKAIAVEEAENAVA